MNLEQLKKQERELTELLSANRSNQRQLNKIAFIEKNGFDVGDVVEWVDGKNARKGIISQVDFNGTAPYYKAKIFNSDGKVGKREVKIWSFYLKTMKLVKHLI